MPTIRRYRSRSGIVFAAAAAVAPLSALATGCTSFSTVRSAEVSPGPSLGLQGSASMPPGDGPAWFWSFDCATDCDHPIVGGDAGLTYGWPGVKGAFALGIGTSGSHPYIDAYAQLGTGRSPWGIGGRLGVIGSWREHQVYGRYDVRFGDRSRLLLNPALFIHEGASPNGENPGKFVGFVQGIGMMFEGRHVSWTPAIALVAGQTNRTNSGQDPARSTSVFGAASLGMTLHRERK